MYKSHIRNGKNRGAKGERELELPDDAQFFAIVQDMLGNGRLRALCEDGVVRVGRIRGSMRKYKSKVIIGRGDLIIVARREFEDDKLDVVHKYTHDEASKLLVRKFLPDRIHRALTTDADMSADAAAPEEEFVLFGEDVDVARI